jgi:hypothetical protein
MKFQFGNIVVVDDDQIGVIVKSWGNDTHDVYVRSYNQVSEYSEKDIKHYVYSKYLSEEEHEFY